MYSGHGLVLGHDLWEKSVSTTSSFLKTEEVYGSSLKLVEEMTSGSTWTQGGSFGVQSDPSSLPREETGTGE